MSCATLIDENSLALTGNTVLLYRNLFIRKMREFWGVAKSDGYWKRGDPLCFSWDIELFFSLTPATTGSGRFVVAVLCALLRLMVFFGCRLKRVEIAVHS
jgi:hypothetical protein